LNYRYIFAFQYNRVDKVRGPLTKSNCPITRDWRSSNFGDLQSRSKRSFLLFRSHYRNAFSQKNWTIWLHATRETI